MCKYSVIIPVTKKNIEFVKNIYSCLCKNLPAHTIVFITAHDNIQLLNGLKNSEVVDEDTVYRGMNLDKIKEIIKERIGEDKRAGWYFQQFLKMAWALNHDEDYIVWDADTIPLRKLQFEENNKKIFDIKIEYHEPYFKTIDKLFEGKVKRNGQYSFIAEHMIISHKIMKKMILDIENNENLLGKSFWEKILYAIEHKDLNGSGFSEFETYGNYVKTYFEKEYLNRKLSTCREATTILGNTPTSNQLEWASRDYDIITIEMTSIKRKMLPNITKRKCVMSLIRMKTIVKIRNEIRTLYRKLMKRNDIKYD